MTLPPLPARWYCVSRDGLATLCASEQNAIEMASDCARDYPRQAPYRAVLMGDVAAERERCAAICDARSADHWRAYSDKSSPHFCDARFEAFSDEAEECAKLIRGDNVGAKRGQTAARTVAEHATVASRLDSA